MLFSQSSEDIWGMVFVKCQHSQGNEDSAQKWTSHSRPVCIDTRLLPQLCGAALAEPPVSYTHLLLSCGTSGHTAMLEFLPAMSEGPRPRQMDLHVKWKQLVPEGRNSLAKLVTRLTFILTLPTPPMPFQMPSWCCALVLTSVCSEQMEGWPSSCHCSGAGCHVWHSTSLPGTPSWGDRTLSSGTKEEFARDVTVAQSRWSHMSCGKPLLHCGCACSLRAQLGQDSDGSYCTGFVPHLDWEITQTIQFQKQTCCRRGKILFPCLLCNFSERVALFFENKNPQENKTKMPEALCSYWSASVWYQCSWHCIYVPPYPIYCDSISKSDLWGWRQGENTHRVSVSLWRRRNHCVLSNPQQLDLLGINVFPLLLFGILVFFIQHDPMVCNWIEIHTVRIAITKAYLRRIAWTTCHLKGHVYRINAFSSVNYLQK